MARTLILGFAVALCLAHLAHADQEAAWDDQIRAMGYLIVHLSNINVAGGLNLSREQAVALGDLARRVEAAAPPPPNLAGRYRPDLAVVRDTYVAVRQRLLAGEDVDDTLRRRVAEARRIEADVIRLSLTPLDASQSGCARCHRAPEAPDVRKTRGGPAYRQAAGQAVTTPERRREVFMAHHEGVLGKAGIVAVALATKRVDDLLRAAQKDGLADFSCCITPPKDLTDPYRIGQAKSSDASARCPTGCGRWSATGRSGGPRRSRWPSPPAPTPTERATSARRSAACTNGPARSATWTSNSTGTRWRPNSSGPPARSPSRPTASGVTWRPSS